ncbi:hypothetical protein [Salinirarus marinus]|uniref:hypothetical protein n=1 Tax=Salinirarus marinus TaxID=3068310 RepID=UPI003C6C5108
MVLRLVSDEAAVFGVVAFVILAALALVGALAYAEHRKEMPLIEAGAYEEARGDRTWLLAAGLLLLAVGIADLLRSALLGVVPESGITLSMLGLASLVYYYLRLRETRRKRASELEASESPADERTD